MDEVDEAMSHPFAFNRKLGKICNGQVDTDADPEFLEQEPPSLAIR